MTDDPEKFKTKNPAKRSGLRGLILFAIFTFAISYTTVFLFTTFHNLKLAKIEELEFDIGFIQRNVYQNQELGWQV